MAQTLQHQIVARALSLIADERNWTTCALARDQGGKPCAYASREAIKFCAVGALMRAALDLFGNGIHARAVAIDMAKRISEANGHAKASLACINDSRGHAAMVSMFERALAE